jgi:hypothetical protein
MATRDAACHCGQLRLEVAGDPLALSICNCLACQRRTGSAFGMQAAFKADQVQVVGRFSDFARISDEADRKEHVFHFCPDCGSQVFYTEPTEPDMVVVSVGSFADPAFPPPTESGYDSRRHHWVGLPDSIQRYAPELWDPVRPLYDAGRYAEAADRGRDLIDAHPDQAYLYYNVACCESLAGRTADAIEHLRQSIDMWEGCRDMAREELRLRSNLRRPCVRGTDRPLGIKSRRPASSFHSTSSPRALAMDGRPERRLAVLNASRAIFPALSLIRAGVAELVDAAGLGPVGSQGPWRFESSRPHRLGVNGAESGYIRSLPASIDRKEARRCTSAAASSR